MSNIEMVREKEAFVGSYAFGNLNGFLARDERK